MATAPFTGAFITQLEGREYAYRLSCFTGEIVQFKFFCCDNPYDTSVSKAPVVVATITPDTQCVNVAINVNFDASWSPLDTISTWRIEWGDGTPDDVPGPAWPPGNRPHTYTTVGTYNLKITLTDTSGLTGTQTYQVLIIDCADGSVLARYGYALSTSSGPWLRDFTAAPPHDWTQCTNNLAGNWLVGRDLKVDPHRRHLPVAIRHVWITTQAGVAKSVDNMSHWMRLYDSMPAPRNDDGGAAVKADLDWWTVAFNPMEIDHVYVLATTATRAWVYWTEDGGATWHNWQVCY